MSLKAHCKMLSRSQCCSLARLTIERLEGRFLLAPIQDPTDFFIPDSDDPNSIGTIDILFDNQDDVIRFEFLNATTARLTINGMSYDYQGNRIESIGLHTAGGNDLVEIAADVGIPVLLMGGKGNDSLIGGAADDTLDGGNGKDTLHGGEGNDVLIGADQGQCVQDTSANTVCGPVSQTERQDLLEGADGDDTLAGSSADDTMLGGGGTNQIIEFPNGTDVFVGTLEGADTITVELFAASTLRITVNGITYEYPYTLVSRIDIDARGGDDFVQIGSDITVQTNVDGGSGNDTLIGGGGSDTILGGQGDDSLDGGLGADSLSGGDGDDTLADGMGDDTLDGGTGNDVYDLTPGSDDVLRDSAGVETVSFARAGRGITMDLGRSAGQRQFVDGSRNTVALNGVFEHAVGSAFADDITGNALPNRIDGGGGDDTLDGGGGDRSLHGRPNGAPPDRRAGGGCDGDSLAGGPGHDWLDGGRGRDALSGNDGDDVLVGDPARDTLDGGAGVNQSIAVLKSAGICSAGGAARAEIVAPRTRFSPLTGRLTVEGDEAGPTDDVIRVSPTVDGFVEVTLNGGVHSSDPNSANFDTALEGASISTVLSLGVSAADGNDRLSVDGGFPAADGRITLDGGTGDDVFAGGAGAEILLGGPGDDMLSGGDGNDTVAGGDGNDHLDGGSGIDTADFANSSRSVRVNLARQSARGQGADRLAALENVLGSNFNDLLIGDSLANLLIGGNGNDMLRGGNGGDTLVGNDGDDRLLGELGNDQLDGGTGTNRLKPGPEPFAVLLPRLKARHALRA